jgi:cytochrome oxidase assembly protein ShyY1
MRPIRRLNGVHVVVGRGWVLAKQRNSGRPRTKQIERTSEQGNARVMALVEWQHWQQTKSCSGSFLCYGIEGFLKNISLAFY